MKKIIQLMIMASILLAANAMAETGISRSIFTTAIEDKEPVSDMSAFTNKTAKIYFFTELTGLKGHTITHRWEYNNKTMAELSFEIGADRWRTWSSKNILPGWTGTWQVSVLDEGGNIMDQKTFEYDDESIYLKDDTNTDTSTDTDTNTDINTDINTDTENSMQPE